MVKNKKRTKTSYSRPPIVVVLGHVDHGKTTLLDAIRKTSFAKKEAGGITQGIGASVAKTKDGSKITFIDTPGHAAFEQMRSRGAKVADLAVLVVAADDGVKPQTTEAIKHIKSANIPFIIALTKIDLKRADINSAKNQLEKEEVSLEGKGGDTPVVLVSGKTGKGIDDFLEMIVLVAEMKEVQADPNGDLEAVVIETRKDKRGPTISVVVRNGKIRTGDEVEAEGLITKVRGLFDFQEKRIGEILPGEPALILGFSELPKVGAIVASPGKTKVVEKEKTLPVEPGKDEIPVIIKAKNAGSLEAVVNGLPEKVALISSSAGDVIESDIFLAKAAGPAYIFVFESSVSTSVKKLAETEGVEIHKFDIIYELFQKIEEIIAGKEKKVLAKVEVLAEFPYNKKRIAGCRVVSGEIRKGDKLILMKGEKEIRKARIVSMKKQKDEIKIAKAGEECGLLFGPQLDFEIGDVLVSVANE